MHVPEEVLTLVKIPVKEIEEWIRSKHLLPRDLVDCRIEEDSLLLYFSEESALEMKENSSLPEVTTRRRRKARRKRNRMRTRGWEVVARIENSKGQRCSVYRPFVDALHDSELTPEEQRASVEKILRSNRNRPSNSSVQYFLENTLEYLQNQAKEGGNA
jgi:hypothetical protein